MRMRSAASVNYSSPADTRYKKPNQDGCVTGTEQNNTDQSTSLYSSNRMKGKLVIEVKDSGAGISVEDQKRLFKEIVQFRPQVLQAGGGSGLGLFITKGLVDIHDGKISVHSEGEGKGTTFRVELPMEKVTACSPTTQPALSSLNHTDWNFTEDFQPAITNASTALKIEFKGKTK